MKTIMPLSELVLPALVGVVLLVLLPSIRRVRLRRLENAWLPSELHCAAPIYREQVFRARSPVPVVAKVDRGYRSTSGVIVLVEFKTRRMNRPYQSDVIELSAQRLAVQAETGADVADYGYVLVMLAGKQRKMVHRVDLMSVEKIIAVARRRDAILSGEALPQFAASKGLCVQCPYKSVCYPAGDRA